VKEWHEIRAALERQHLAAWKDRLWGICRTDEEALGLALAGFRAIIIGTIGIPGRAGNPPAGAGRILTARGWAEARRIIDKNL
jgi:hypothetical protein